MAERWRGWAHESAPRRRMFVAALLVLAVLAVITVVGTIEGGGLFSPWLWSGLVLVPILLWLVSRVGLSK